ncbi:unnamed protein product [Acanthoscelides obtectus]|uniref:Calcium channel flower n=1 Tax=Acanthoscelides obtectus TaxID=200917 RepID=A0A9P0LYV5_ACAOB|nr:unnamed protein product [Acanthoscelides obtectus]CAK1623213.1 Calcium channel flower [Acanthoscelides obtectus]
MSIQEKLTALMARPGQDPVGKDDVAWWLKFGGRALGTVGGFAAMFLGVFVVISFSPLNIVGGLLQIVAGFIVLCCEAPCCCMFVDNVQRLADFVDSRPYWNRAAAYVVLALVPFFLSFFTLSAFFGCGLIFGTGILYGMMALGKKGSREDMATVASPQMATTPTGVAQNDHRTTLMEDPDVWRPT